VDQFRAKHTTETQRTQRLHREIHDVGTLYKAAENDSRALYHSFNANVESLRRRSKPARKGNKFGVESIEPPVSSRLRSAPEL